MIIEARGIRKSYGKLQVLKGIEMQVGEGEIVSIVGASGAGKSTLLQILGTLDKADEGQVIIKGRDISRMRGRELARFRNQELGFVFQFHHLLPEFTAIENVCFPAFIGGMSRSAAMTRAKDLLAVLNLSARADHKPGALSGGEQQRVAVARALMNKPSVVFADEPSGNLDSKSASELHDLFFDLRGQIGQTFVMVTHNETLANRADRKLSIVDGIIEL